MAEKPHQIAWFSVTQPKSLYNSGGWKVAVIGRLVCVNVTDVNIGGGSWDSKYCPYTIPTEYRPASDVYVAMAVNNKAVSRKLIAQKDGRIKVWNVGGAGSTDACGGTLTYVAGF